MYHYQSILQFRGDLVLRPKTEDREVVDEIVASGRPVRQDGVIGRLHGAALKLPLGIQVAVQAVVDLALVVQRADAVGLQGQRAVVAATERRDGLQLLEMRVARRPRAPSLQITPVDEGCRLADRRAVRAELLAVVDAGSAVLAQTRAEGAAVLRVAEARARRADARLVARLERRERHVRLECGEISGGASRFVRGLVKRRLRHCDRLRCR